MLILHFIDEKIEIQQCESWLTSYKTASGKVRSKTGSPELQSLLLIAMLNITYKNLM